MKFLGASFYLHGKDTIVKTRREKKFCMLYSGLYRECLKRYILEAHQGNAFGLFFELYGLEIVEWEF